MPPGQGSGSRRATSELLTDAGSAACASPATSVTPLVMLWLPLLATRRPFGRGRAAASAGAGAGAGAEAECAALGPRRPVLPPTLPPPLLRVAALVPPDPASACAWLPALLLLKSSVSEGCQVPAQSVDCMVKVQVWPGTSSGSSGLASVSHRPVPRLRSKGAVEQE